MITKKTIQSCTGHVTEHKKYNKHNTDTNNNNNGMHCPIKVNECKDV